MHDPARISDHLALTAHRHASMMDRAGLRGMLTIARFGPDGALIEEDTVPNLVTRVGDQVYGERGGGVSGAPAAPTGMRLGTDNTAAAKTGAGAAIVAYQTGSALAFTTPAASSLSGSSRRITYVCQWSGSETWTGLQEAVITNAAIADAAGAEADTVSRSTFASKAKDSADTLTATWTHDLLGA